MPKLLKLAVNAYQIFCRKYKQNKVNYNKYSNYLIT